MTWNELVEKVKDIDGVITYKDGDLGDYIELYGTIGFFKNGSIDILVPTCRGITENALISENRTPAQMHTIILALTGDEK